MYTYFCNHLNDYCPKSRLAQYSHGYCNLLRNICPFKAEFPSLQRGFLFNQQEYETLFLSDEQPPEKKSPEKRLPLLVEKLKVAVDKPKVIEKPIVVVVKKDPIVFDKNIPKPPKSDIQEKHNKHCSSCNITFDSR